MAGGKNRADKATYRCPPCPTMLVCHHRLSWSRRRGICDVKTTKHAVSTLHNLVFPTSRPRSTAMPIRRSLLRHLLSYKRENRARYRRKRRYTGPQDTIKTTHRMLLTSLPTLFAYAPWSLLSFVFRLILKNTSSPFCVVTCVCHGSGTEHVSSAATAEPGFPSRTRRRTARHSHTRRQSHRRQTRATSGRY